MRYCQNLYQKLPLITKCILFSFTLYKQYTIALEILKAMLLAGLSAYEIMFVNKHFICSLVNNDVSRGSNHRAAKHTHVADRQCHSSCRV
jgi:hypothetical protein